MVMRQLKMIRAHLPVMIVLTWHGVQGNSEYTALKYINKC